MNINRILLHILFVCVFATLFAKLQDGAPTGGLIFMNTLLVFAGIIYGMFTMKQVYKKQIKDALEDLKKNS